MMDNAFTTGSDRKLQSTSILFILTFTRLTFKTFSCLNLWSELARRLSVDFISLQKVKVKVMYEEFILVPDDNNNDLEFLN